MDAAGADDAAAAAARRGPAEGDQAHPHLHRHRRRYNLTSSTILCIKPGQEDNLLEFRVINQNLYS